MASQSSEIAKLKAQISESQGTVASATAQIETATAQVTSYENLLKAYNAYQEENYDSVMNVFGNIDSSVLSVDGRMLYDTIYEKVSGHMFESYKDTGISAYLAGEYEKAVENLLKAMEIEDEDYHVMDYLANAYRYLGMPDEAKAVYQKIVDAFPNTRRSENAQSYINAIDRGTDISVEMKNSGQTADIGSLDDDISPDDGDGAPEDDGGTGGDGDTAGDPDAGDVREDFGDDDTVGNNDPDGGAGIDDELGGGEAPNE